MYLVLSGYTSYSILYWKSSGTGNGPPFPFKSLSLFFMPKVKGNLYHKLTAACIVAVIIKTTNSKVPSSHTSK